jgi:hypothetical protein
MRADFMVCPKWPAGSDHVDRRGENSKAKGGRGWSRECYTAGARVQLTASRIRAHFTECAKRPAASTTKTGEIGTRR